MCLGYSILQIPDLILLIIRKLKKYYLKFWFRRHSIGPLLPIRIVVQENQLNNEPDSTTNNSQLDNNDDVQSLKIELNKLTETVNKLTEKVENLTERLNASEIESYLLKLI